MNASAPLLPDCVPSDVEGNVGLAFGIVTAAGLSTTIGAALAFVMPYSRSAKNLFLAACLAIAAGVMIYVSFVEIFAAKAVGEFEKCFTEEDAGFAYLYATLCFFAGMAITWLFDRALHALQHAFTSKRAPEAQKGTAQDNGAIDKLNYSNSADTSSGAAAADIDKIESQVDNQTKQNGGAIDEAVEVDPVVGHGGHLIASLYDESADNQDSSALIRMGIFAGVALAFHNFPEGLATFVSVLEDPSVGASVAIAIAIHNIPEGVCVAMPIYYATGSRMKAFFWATLSGMTELAGALLGYIVLKSVITPQIYAVLFGIVGGMMVYISLKELIPTAHRYDPDDQVTSFGIVIGMLIMAASLVLFSF